MEHSQLVEIEQQLKQAQEQLELHSSAFADGDEKIVRVQQIIDGLWALFNRARQNSGSVTPADFAPGFEQLQAEMAQVTGHGSRPRQ